MTTDTAITIRPADAATWPDVEFLLDRPGAVRGCWCMFFRLSSRELRDNGDRGNRAALCSLAEQGAAPGLLAYRDRTAVGWVSIAPREQFPRLDRSPVAKPVDDTPVWALTCLFVPREARGTGVARELVRGALEYAREQGGSCVEAYPVDDTLGPVHPDHAYHGWVSLLLGSGFTEVARRTPKRPVLRRRI
ncbi:GNAT family N-acetyltransferase [Sciscionella sediminilitoris]|uniref:GNAT family N-acetyltransferase n=1 Tax=Sciscionella sediminilitoris TaxID=1445613 RepID=UPI0004DF65D0|nr:GNAT family N-acetyltransferase [Sciscionella sp. SE31]